MQTEPALISETVATLTKIIDLFEKLIEADYPVADIVCLGPLMIQVGEAGERLHTANMKKHRQQQQRLNARK
ncbi:hypothetical protein BH11PLA2_BH11PLA2_43890 [soil metagenome]